MKNVNAISATKKERGAAEQITEATFGAVRNVEIFFANLVLMKNMESERLKKCRTRATTFARNVM
jgi:hypothetical protein